MPNFYLWVDGDHEAAGAMIHPWSAPPFAADRFRR
jgi:hypothetical protein